MKAKHTGRDNNSVPVKRQESPNLGKPSTGNGRAGTEQNMASHHPAGSMKDKPYVEHDKR